MSDRSSATRRTVLRGAALTPVVGLGLAACSAAGNGGGASAAPTAPVSLGPESEIPQGGAKLYRDANVVVSRTADGLKAYSTICTHAGCAIDKLDGTTLICPCHGSRFDALTGKVVQAPATEPLHKLSAEVKNGGIVAGPAA
ncbi:Rieske (2Fe-2S) protein [Streptomyces sp. NPDC055722]